MPPIQATDPSNVEDTASEIGVSIAEGILRRIGSFPSREEDLKKRDGEMDSLPEDILWNGFGVEAAPVFVMY